VWEGGRECGRLTESVEGECVGCGRLVKGTAV
jgi:hypothetical protein